MFFRFFFIVLAACFLAACSIANLQPAALADGQITDPATKGRELLPMTYEKMGYDALGEVEAYEATANFDWATVWGMMPMNSLPGAKGKDIQFRFATNTFDGHLEFLEGPNTGQARGVQSWGTYQRASTAAPAEKLGSKRYPWGLATLLAGEANTRSFGQPSAGLTTGNQLILLSDDAGLNLSVSYLATKEGEVITGRIPVDVVLELGAGEADSVLAAALNWLLSE